LAERRKLIELIEASKDAEREALRLQVSAERKAGGGGSRRGVALRRRKPRPTPRSVVRFAPPPPPRADGTRSAEARADERGAESC
jgi:hypothetical protein